MCRNSNTDSWLSLIDETRNELVNRLNSYEMKLRTLGHKLHIETDAHINKNYKTLNQ